MSDNISAELKLFINEKIEKNLNTIEQQIARIREDLPEKANRARNQAISILGFIVVIISLLSFFKVDDYIRVAVKVFFKGRN